MAVAAALRMFPGIVFDPREPVPPRFAHLVDNRDDDAGIFGRWNRDRNPWGLGDGGVGGGGGGGRGEDRGFVHLARVGPHHGPHHGGNDRYGQHRRIDPWAPEPHIRPHEPAHEYERPQQPRQGFLPPLSSSVKVQVVHDTAKFTVTHVFWNRADTIKQGTYQFPLPLDATVTEFNCRIGVNRVIRGKVKGKEEARRDFDNAVRQGRTGGLVEQQTAEIFTINLANIEANTKMRAELSFMCLLKHRTSNNRDVFTLTVPTFIAPRYGDVPHGVAVEQENSHWLNFEADILTADELITVNSDTHNIRFERAAGQRACQTWDDFVMRRDDAEMSQKTGRIQLEDGRTSLGKDLVITITTAQSENRENPLACVEVHPDLDNHKAVMLTLPSEYLLTGEGFSHDGEIIFVADRSGSMTDKIESLKSAMLFFINGIPENRPFNIWCFGSECEYMWPRSKGLTEQTRQEAINYVQRNFAADMGGTDILPALKKIYESRGGYHTLDVVVLTDGAIWGPQETIDYVKEKRLVSEGLFRCFALGIGYSVSHELVEGLAKAGGGYAEVITNVYGGGWEDRVVAVLKSALAGHVGSVEMQLEWHGEDGQELVQPPVSFKQSPADISAISPFIRNRVFLLFDSGVQTAQLTAVKLNIRVPGSEAVTKRVLPKRLLQPDATLHKLAVRALLGDLERGESWLHRRRGGVDDAVVRQEAIDLGMKWSLVSKWTSLYAVEEETAEPLDIEIPDLEPSDDDNDVLLRARGGANQNAGLLGPGATAGRGGTESDLVSDSEEDDVQSTRDDGSDSGSDDADDGDHGPDGGAGAAGQHGDGSGTGGADGGPDGDNGAGPDAAPDNFPDGAPGGHPDEAPDGPGDRGSDDAESPMYDQDAIQNLTGGNADALKAPMEVSDNDWESASEAPRTNSQIHRDMGMWQRGVAATAGLVQHQRARSRTRSRSRSRSRSRTRQRNHSGARAPVQGTAALGAAVVAAGLAAPPSAWRRRSGGFRERDRARSRSSSRRRSSRLSRSPENPAVTLRTFARVDWIDDLSSTGSANSTNMDCEFGSAPPADNPFAPATQAPDAWESTASKEKPLPDSSSPYPWSSNPAASRSSRTTTSAFSAGSSLFTRAKGTYGLKKAKLATGAGSAAIPEASRASRDAARAAARAASLNTAPSDFLSAATAPMPAASHGSMFDPASLSHSSSPGESTARPSSRSEKEREALRLFGSRASRDTTTSTTSTTSQASWFPSTGPSLAPPTQSASPGAAAPPAPPAMPPTLYPPSSSAASPGRWGALLQRMPPSTSPSTTSMTLDSDVYPSSISLGSYAYPASNIANPSSQQSITQQPMMQQPVIQQTHQQSFSPSFLRSSEQPTYPSAPPPSAPPRQSSIGSDDSWNFQSYSTPDPASLTMGSDPFFGAAPPTASNPTGSHGGGHVPRASAPPLSFATSQDSYAGGNYSPSAWDASPSMPPVMRVLSRPVSSYPETPSLVGEPQTASAPVFNPPASTFFMDSGRSAPKTEEELAAERFVRDILTFQRSDGSFHFRDDEELKGSLGPSLFGVVTALRRYLAGDKCPEPTKRLLAVAAAVVALLEEQFAACRALWVLMAGKATDYVTRNARHGRAGRQLLEEARRNVKGMGQVMGEVRDVQARAEDVSVLTSAPIVSL